MRVLLIAIFEIDKKIVPTIFNECTTAQQPGPP